MIKHFLALLFSAVFLLPSSAQIDTSFWFVAPKVPAVIGVNSVSLQVGAYSQSVSLRVRQPANIAGVNLTFTLAANSSSVIDLTPFQTLITSTLANASDIKGLYISATDRVSVNYIISSNAGQESISMKGTNGCGYDFYTPFPNNINTLATGTTVGNVGFDVVATEPGLTTLLITPRANLVGPRTENVTFVTTLNQGETYSCREGLKSDGKPRSIITANFNNDLSPDMAIVDQQYNSLFIFLNNGSGAFTETSNYALGLLPTKVIAADLNADANQDLIITNSGSNNLSVFMGTGTGNFTGPTNFTTNATPVSVACADVNNDTFLDLVVAENGANSVRVLNGNGAGSFTSSASYAVGTQPTDVAIGDVNNNGAKDLAVTNGGSGNVSVLMGSTTGTFALSLTLSLTNGIPTNPSAVLLVDLNADGNLDMAVANRGTGNANNNLTMFRGNAAGTFTTAQQTFGLGNNAQSPVGLVTILNSGAAPDLYSINYGSHNISFFKNTSGTSISFATGVNMAVGGNPYAMAKADIDADGRMDLVAANFATGNYSSLLGTGAGTMNPAVTTLYGYTKPLLPSGLAGSIVSADKKISLTMSGALATNTLCSTFYADQITTSGKIGMDYVINQSEATSDLAYVLAPVNSTSLNVTTSSTANWVINTGETYTVNASANPVSYISADKPVYVFNLAGHGCKLGGAQLAQVYCAGSYTTGFERMSADSLFLQICTRSGYQSTFTLDVNSSPVAVPAASFNPVPGSAGNLVTARIYYNTAIIPVGAYCVLKNSADIFDLSLQNGSSQNGMAFSQLSNFDISSFVIANSAPTATICSNTQFTLNGVIGGGPITGIWSYNGFGSLSGPNTQITNNIYTPSPIDTSLSPIKLILSSTGICPNKSDTLKLTVKQGPIVSAGSDVVICSNNPTVQLSGNVFGAANQGIWSVVAPGSGTFVSAVNAFTTSYSLSPADTALAQLKFVLTSTNNAGCNPEHDTVAVIINKPPVVTASPVNPLVVCANNSTVFLNGTVSGTTTSTGSWQTSGSGIFIPNNLSLISNYLPSVADIGAGSIYLKLQSTNNLQCKPVTDSVQVVFTQPSVPNAGADINSCKNSPRIALNAVVTGTATNTGIWLGGSGLFIPSNTALNPTYIASTSEINSGFVLLTFSTTNSGICAESADDVQIKFQDSPTANFTVNTVCLNQQSVFTDQSLNTSGLPGGVINSWQWDAGNGTSFTTPNPVYTFTAPGTYTASLIVKNAFNCYDTIQRPVTVHPLPTPGISVSRACNGSAQLITFQDQSSIASPGTIPSTGYYWDFGGEGFSLSKDTAIIFPSEGIYGVTHIVTSSNNCKSVITQSVNITPKPRARFKIINNSTLGLGANISFLDSSNIVPTLWSWHFGNGDSSSIKNPVTTYTANGTYTVSLTIADQFGCTDTFTSTINIRSIASEITQLIPNMITPNGDGKNDIWRLDFIDVYFPSADIEIYSRWGERIFKSTGYSNAWDGSYKGDPLPVGAYFYIIKLNNKENQIYKGSVTLLK